MSNSIIKIDDVSKIYRLGEIGTGTLYKDLHRTWARWRGKPDPLATIGAVNNREQKGGEYVSALKNIDLEILAGETIGIIGRNGAGKSTLLKILSRVTAPTTGRIRIKGRIASLLEVGTGFHPELTGRENVYLNGAIMGMTRREVARRLEEIVEFSGCAKYIDTPVKRYSSGMKVRLGFSVAAHLECEILIVDEVLAVGDAEFQKKCLGKMGDVAETGRTILFVSHQMDMIRALCERSVLIDEGKVIRNGESEVVISEYTSSFTNQENAASFQVAEDEDLPIQIISGKIVDANDKIRDKFDVFEPIALEFDYIVRNPRDGANVCFRLKRNNSILFISFDSDENPKTLTTKSTGIYTTRIELPCPLLKPGRYSVTPETGIPNLETIQQLEDALRFDVELLSQPSAFASYAEKRPGVIAVPLSWHTKNH